MASARSVIAEAKVTACNEPDTVRARILIHQEDNKLCF